VLYIVKKHSLLLDKHGDKELTANVFKSSEFDVSHYL